MCGAQVFCLDFSPDLTKAVTASGDGLLKVGGRACWSHLRVWVGGWVGIPALGASPSHAHFFCVSPYV